MARNASIEVRLWKRRHPLAHTICVLMLLPLIGVLAARLAAVVRSPAFRGEDDAELTRTELYLASGNEGSWWADDASTYYLLPPVRTYAADQQCDLPSLTSIVLENGGDEAAGGAALVVDREGDPVQCPLRFLDPHLGPDRRASRTVSVAHGRRM